MQPEQAETQSTLDLSNSSISISLEPIRTLGSAALDPHGQPEVNKVTLRQLQIARENALHEVLTIASDDLLKSPKPPAAAQTMPQDGTVAAAILGFQFSDCDRPHAVEFRPPRTIYYAFPSDAQRVPAWLVASQFRLTTQFANTAAIIIHALATALVPALADGDNDEDDLDHDRRNHPSARVLSFAYVIRTTLRLRGRAGQAAARCRMNPAFRGKHQAALGGHARSTSPVVSRAAGAYLL